ncbi:hypothetical protein ACS0TY_015132 [Phlomoides rotata]
MASYAALLSLAHTIRQIKNHPRSPISLDLYQVNSLMENVTLLQHFLERYSEEDDDLESRITVAAYAAEDVIESLIVHQIRVGSTSYGGNIRSVDLCQRLEKVMGEMNLIKNEVMKISQQKIIVGAQHHNLHLNSSVSTTMAEFDDDDVLINEVLDKLTGQQCGLQVIPIVGMAGIGKTTLARYIYENALIVERFDIRAWVTISQEYSMGNILQVLCQDTKGGNLDLSEISEDEVGEILYKHLWGRRYLIVMDDIWSIEAWDKVRSFFPDNSNGSRIMITTRLSNPAIRISGSSDIQMKFLDKDKSWNLLCKVVFGKKDCPMELENIGKEIAESCRGLPLSIVVIGGVLRNSNMTKGYWEYTLGNVSSLVNLENNDHCLQILHTSYKELPVHLKSCFLYMGVFPEDNNIRVSHVVKLWVAEGILKPIEGKSLEEVAEEYVKELIDRNLILIRKLGWNGKAKECKIHDLLRDLCLREAQKQRKLDIPRGRNTERRIRIHENTEDASRFLRALESAWQTVIEASTVIENDSLVTYSENAIFQPASLRYLSLRFNFDALSRFTSLCSLLWNVQTLKVIITYFWEPIIAPSEIWEMPLLRHVILDGFQLPEPPHGVVLENLHTLSRVKNFRCSKDVVKRIPNIKKLKFEYVIARLNDEEELPDLCLENLHRLRKLESFNLSKGLNCIYDHEFLVHNVVFPHSLKKLSLCGTMLTWKEMTVKIGSLPLLQVLRLHESSCVGAEWVTGEGQFCNLKFLLINDMFGNLRYWRTESSHFPRLEQLHLRHFVSLEEIPSCIGDIPTLMSIRLERCSKSVKNSAQRIKKEQVDNGNEDLQVLCENKLHKWRDLRKKFAQMKGIKG